jgi:hypothetical protein
VIEVRTVTDIDFNQWRDELTVPPVQDSLRLGDDLADDAKNEILRHIRRPDTILSYSWHLESHYEKAARWAKSSLTAIQANLPGMFFIDAIVDLYDYDRALHAATALGRQPILGKDIPHSLTRWVSNDNPEEHQKAHGIHGGVYSTDPIPLEYSLSRRVLSWTRDTPESALDATALVIETEPPDKLWIVEYVLQSQYTYDPIIYAEYEAWQVEVARWE